LPEVERPELTINGSVLNEAQLDPLVVRPDRDAVLTLSLAHRGERGCLFGYVNVLDDWGRLVSPRAVQITWLAGADTAISQSSEQAYFALRPGQALQAQISLPAQRLLTLPRPAEHPLHVEFVTQFGMEAQRSETLVCPVQILLRPAYLVIEPAEAAIAPVRRGVNATTTGNVRNTGELLLNAKFAKRSDDTITVAPRELPNGGEIAVEIDSLSIPYGAEFEKTVWFAADGDVDSAAFTVRGAVLPTAFQAVFRQQPARDRVVLALLGGTVGALVSLGTNIAFAYPWFWTLWLAFAGALAAGTTYWVVKHIVKYIQASGETNFTMASVNWPWVISVAAGTTVALGLIVALSKTGETEKALAMFYLLSAIGATVGFFFNDTWAFATRPAQTRVSAITRMIKPHHLPALSVALIVITALFALALVLAISANLWQPLLLIAVMLAFFAFIA
jgi:hypothetical protein